MNSTTSDIVSAYNKPSHSRTIYSDRFIPSRTSSNFSLFNLSPPKSEYATRIHTALFGPESPSVSPDMSVTGGKNIFKFKSETRQALHSLLDDHLHGVIQSPVKPLRTFPKFPYKVTFKFNSCLIFECVTWFVLCVCVGYQILFAV